MSKLPALRCVSVLIASAAFVLGVAACKPPVMASKNAHTLTQIFTVGGKFADDSMYACLADALAQHIPYKQALVLCETKLLTTGPNGFGESSSGSSGNLPGGLPGGGKPFDPSSVTSSCSAGDPSRAAPTGGTAVYIDADGRNWGEYSWGSGAGYNGMSAAESRAAKESAVSSAKLAEAATLAAEKAVAAVNSAVIAVNVPGAQQLVNGAAAVRHAAVKAENEANRKAMSDPNASSKTPGSSSSSSGSSSGSSGAGSSSGSGSGSSSSSSGGRSSSGSSSGSGSGGKPPKHTGEGSACELALQAAREFLYECNRNGWKSTDCQQLNARMNGCPDPTLILVDPDQGYTCGETPDPLAVVIAARDKCQQLKRGVDGTDPCGVPSFDGYVLTPEGFDMCSNPVAYIDPDSGACVGTLTLPKMGPDIQEIIVFALNKIGGPIFVLPLDPKPPGGWSPRPEPRPGPR